MAAAMCLLMCPLARLLAQAGADSARRAEAAAAGGDSSGRTTQRIDRTRVDSTGGRARRLLPAVIVGARVPAVSHLSNSGPGLLYTGVAATVLRVDDLGANTATNEARAVLGRVPGANFSETRGDGFPSDGVGFRGLNPTQSIEVNTRQNGVNIAADVFGYPETYYTPPFEAVDRVEIVRGASGLQYGAQIGGMVNYVLRDGVPGEPLTVTVHQTGGSFGRYDAFGSVGGGRGGRWTYYGFAHYERTDGWRPNGNYWDRTAYGSLTYRASDRLTASLELTSERNWIHMPGGLTDQEFAADPTRSYRPRNWLASPWNVMAAHTTLRLSSAAILTTTLSGLLSQRYLVWRNEQGGPQVADSIDPSTGRYTPREVQREQFRNVTLESRLGVQHALWGRPAAFASGIRLFDGAMRREGAGPGTTGTGFDMTLTGPYGYDLRFSTYNAAGYLEDAVQVAPRLTITPGVRIEWLASGVRGYNLDAARFTVPREVRSRGIVLGGVGAEYAMSMTATAYGNLSQSYRPVTYVNLTPFASTSRVDPHLQDASGYSADLGVRATVGAVTSDIGLFYLWYGHRIGVVAVTPRTTEIANVADSRHVGLESMIDLDLTRALAASRSHLHVGVTNTLAVVDARYVGGPEAGHHVELAPSVIERASVHAAAAGLTSTLVWSYTARAFADATNALTSPLDPGVGVIPAYRVVDWNSRVRLSAHVGLELGIDNLLNARYYTLRTTEYPGPGIIPAIARTASVALHANY